MPEEPPGFAEFALAATPSLLRFGCQLTRSRAHAEDLVQTALLRTWQACGRIERSDDPGVYTRRVMVNAYLTWWRRRGRREQLTGEVPAGAVAAGDDAVCERDELLVALGRLTRRQRAVLVLRFLQDQSEADTAVLLGCSRGTVKSQTAKALARLRTELGSGAELLVTGRKASREQ